MLCSEAADSTLSSIHLHYKLLILKRYFIALNRMPYYGEKETLTQSARVASNVNESGNSDKDGTPKSKKVTRETLLTFQSLTLLYLIKRDLSNNS